MILRPGHRARVAMSFGKRALSYWDTPHARWRVAPGCYRLMVGRSSRDILLRAVLAVGGASCPGAVGQGPGGGGGGEPEDPGLRR